MKLDALISEIQALDVSLRQRVASQANVGLTVRNWLVGAYIIEFEQNGADRAAYGDQLLSTLDERLAVRGLSARSLADCRLFAQHYPENLQTLSAESSVQPILQTLSAKSLPALADGKSRPSFASPIGSLMTRLSFSHFVELLRIESPEKRAFYKIECVKAGWTVRELKRQIGSLLFERLGLSTDKEKLLRIASDNTTAVRPADIIKDPYIFEFLGLTPSEAMREHDLETALLDHLQEFLLELGVGFCFEARQKKIHIGASDYFVDLVFYHRRLHCHVLVELKIEAFSHHNAGQLNTYLNYFQKHELADGDNPPIGLLLCTDQDQTLAEYALGGMDENRFVSTYQVALPKREELIRFLESQNPSL